MLGLLRAVGYLCIPLAYICHFVVGRNAAWEPIFTFILAGLGVIPLASLMGEATEHLADRTGPTWGGLLNATFGNAAELIIGVIALTRGLNEMVAASLTGSILGNLLLVSGAATLVGGWSRESQSFSRAAAETNAGMLVLAVSAMFLPAIFHYSFKLHDSELLAHEHAVSIGTSIILIAIYALGLLFTLRTHAHIFSRPPATNPEEPAGIGALGHGWSNQRSILTLLIASVAIGFVAELLVGSAEAMAQRLNWNPIFVGVILLAIIGNAAEHSTAILLARHNDMDTAMTITYQSSLQIALFAVPVMVFVSALLVHLGVPSARHLNLVFSPLEVAGVMISVLIVVVVNMDGKTNWFEGAMLLALYLILAIVFFYIPAGVAHG